MAELNIGTRVEVIATLPGFHLQWGTITSVTEPFVADERSRQEALRELRLYQVRLDDGRNFRFRGKELRQPTEFRGRY